jgi:hypothetical protein
MDCIELHKLPVFPADAAKKQHYYMQQTIKKPQRVTVCQFMSRMGVLNDYLAYLSMVFDSLMAVAGTKKMNVPFNEADLAGIMLNLVPSSWVNQYNMMHSTPSKNSRARSIVLLSRQRPRKHQLLPRLQKEVPRSVQPWKVLVNCESQRRLGPASFAGTARQRAGPI